MKQGWEIKNFEDCIVKVRNTTKIPKKKFLNDGAYPIISQENEFINGYWDNEDDIFRVEKPLVIFGDHTKKVKYVDFNFVMGADGIKVLQPIDDINARFFFYQIQSLPIEDLGYARHFRLLKKQYLSIPPLDEQKRIVAKLDECFEAIDKARVNVEKNLHNAKDLFQSQLNQIFSQKGDGLVEKNLGEVCEKTYNIKWQENQDVELEYIDLSAVSRETLKITETVSINSSNAPSRAKKIIKTGDIIFATTRPTLKRVAKISNQYNNQICSTGYVVLRSRDEMIKPEIIFYYIQTDMFMDRMESIQRGTSYPAVTDKDVKETIFTFPDIKDVQEDIISRLDEIKAKTQSLEFNYQQELDALDELKKSILQKAFNGEL